MADLMIMNNFAQWFMIKFKNFLCQLSPKKEKQQIIKEEFLKFKQRKNKFKLLNIFINLFIDWIIF
jgi:hypothetical protein